MVTVPNQSPGAAIGWPDSDTRAMSSNSANRDRSRPGTIDSRSPSSTSAGSSWPSRVGVVSPGAVELWEALTLFALYVGYVVFMRYNRAVYGAITGNKDDRDDGGGGTGAAPLPLMDEMGLPIRESLPRVVDKLNEYGLFPVDGDVSLDLDSEEAIFAELGLKYVPPELR